MVSRRLKSYLFLKRQDRHIEFFKVNNCADSFPGTMAEATIAFAAIAAKDIAERTPESNFFIPNAPIDSS